MKSKPDSTRKGSAARTLPLGKLPMEMLHSLLVEIGTNDSVLQGPGIGLDCAVLDMGNQLLVVKSDPITFTASNIGWYAVHVNANDIATTGAKPSWFVATLLLPEKGTDEQLVRSILNQIESACEETGAVLVGGHTEITSGLDRPILSGTMIGVTTKEKLKSPSRIQPGDTILLTKSIAIEAASILAEEFKTQLQDLIPGTILQQARSFLYDPGLSVLPEARIASEYNGVHAMHDPTEGGLSGALWELSYAGSVRLIIEKKLVPLSNEANLICSAMNINPWEAIASGSLLISVSPEDAEVLQKQIRSSGIEVAEIGFAEKGEGVFLSEGDSQTILPKPKRDAIATLFEKN